MSFELDTSWVGRGSLIIVFFFLMIRRLPRSTQRRSSAASDVYKRQALLGYSRSEMESVFDEIVEFSELEQFIDSPIRTYSSGMFARLGFAVATAHVPEVLILDEILSVGDEAFQRKCNIRMKSFQQAGTTVLMVSHALDMLEGMCNRIAWIDHGKTQKIGEPQEVIAAYRGENL